MQASAVTVLNGGLGKSGRHMARHGALRFAVVWPGGRGMVGRVVQWPGMSWLGGRGSHGEVRRGRFSLGVL